MVTFTYNIWNVKQYSYCRRELCRSLVLLHPVVLQTKSGNSNSTKSETILHLILLKKYIDTSPWSKSSSKLLSYNQTVMSMHGPRADPHRAAGRLFALERVLNG